MLLDPRYPPDVARALVVLDDVCRSLAAVSDRLGDVGAVAARLTTATDWQTAAARAFHAGAKEWQGDVGSLRDTADHVRDEVARVRSRTHAASWWAS